MTDRVPAEVFSPGEYLSDEIEARGWSQSELAEILGRPAPHINQIIKGKRSITPEIAKELSVALGTSAMVWLNLEAAYRLHRMKEPVSEKISKQVRIREAYPVRDMIKRGWLPDSENVDVVEGALLAHLHITTMDETPQLTHAAKQTYYDRHITGTQAAWLMRVKNIAETMPTPPYSEAKLRRAIDQMRSLLSAPDEARHVPRLLLEAGVRFVIVEQLPGLKIDGVCFWLDEGKPVIGMSMRYDRIDNFWFVLRHELEHILNRDGTVIDDLDPSTEELSQQEEAANEAAQDFCVAAADLKDFIDRKGPLYTDEKLRRFAKSIGIHSGIVAGQLRRKLNRYDLFTSHLAKVRNTVASTALVDGFGRSLPARS